MASNPTLQRIAYGSRWIPTLGTCMNVSLIETLATRMRMAIESLLPDQLPEPMAKFPKGACGDASLLLGAYLVDNGIEGFKYICGERGNYLNGTWSSHAWLARDELIVDITADQFADGPAKVVVRKSSIWHQKFEIENIFESSDFRTWSGPGTHHLYLIYSRLKSLLTEA